MHLTTYRGGGVLELNYMWLPTWIGMNAALKREIEAELAKTIVNRTVSEGTFSEIDREIIEWLSKRFPKLEGLREYLEGLKFLTQTP